MEKIFKNFFDEIGVTINGNKPYDIQINDERTWHHILKYQSIGAGESYMETWWNCDQLDELFFRICRNNSYNHIYSSLKNSLTHIHNALFNQQTREKCEEVANVHYNLGNRLFELMLGKSMAYTCGYWKEAKTLDEAQFAKYELICKKLQLKPGEKVLELGCGWGGLAKYMAEKYGVSVVAIDIGTEPANYAKQLCNGLPVEIYQCDYRDINLYNPDLHQFDKIVSVGVLEHVGYKNYATFLKIARSFMKDDGLFLLHFIGGNKSINFCDAWIDKYIFPNGMLPSLNQVGKAMEGKFIVEDFHNFGAFYDYTLKAWHKNLNDNWSELKNHYDDKFHRMMNYYLLSCAGAFRARDMQLWQFVLSPRGMTHGYQSIR